ncbi:MAG: FAD-binding oxidoreductase, partial [Bacteroidales bacterium]|nr:FAD-binding oxidoreductase [Bacteroidales bacterium]
MKKFVHDFIVISNKRLNSNHFVLELLSPEPLSTMEPGQFAEVLINGSQDVFLRRPFSIHNADRQKNTISLFIKIVGKGTHALSIVQKGEKLNLIYPLGKGFRLPAHEKILVVGGGCGIAPLLFLVHTLHDRGVKSDIILGARSAGDLLITQQFSRYGNMFLMTEDGSAGEKGLV